jgi:DNA repair exonuclease SbcCD nuclease subunit
MRRNNQPKKADAILTADIELRAFQPTCRTDCHWENQAKKIAWLKELQERHGRCPILDAGDLFDKRYKSNPSHELLGWAMENLPQPFYTIPGNHDLPGKSIENYSNSAMAVLEKAEKLTCCHNEFVIASNKFYIYGYHWGATLIQPAFFNDINIALVHAMVYEEFEPFPGCVGYSAKEVMDLLPDFNLIVCGHNHQTFVRKHRGRVLVNPGSLMRNDADQIDFKPSVFLWFADTNTVERVYVPIEEGVINRDYIDIKKAKETRLDAFVEKLGEQVVSGINFHDNLEAAVSDELIAKGVRDKVWNYYEGLKS